MNIGALMLEGRSRMQDDMLCEDFGLSCVQPCDLKEPAAEPAAAFPPQLVLLLPLPPPRQHPSIHRRRCTRPRQSSPASARPSASLASQPLTPAPVPPRARVPLEISLVQGTFPVVNTLEMSTGPINGVKINRQHPSGLSATGISTNH